MATQGSGAALDIRGPAGLGVAAAIHGRILAALQADDAVAIDLGGAEDIDISLLQTIEAARRYAAANGKRLTLATPAAGELLAQLERCGLIACDADRAFWLDGAEA